MKLHASLITARKDLARIMDALETREQQNPAKFVSVHIPAESRVKSDNQIILESDSDLRTSEPDVREDPVETSGNSNTVAPHPDLPIKKRKPSSSIVHKPSIKETDEEDEELDYLINQEYLDECNIEYLYHMTHVDNLPGILRNGLLSHNKAHRNHDPVDISMGDVNDLRSREEPVFGRSLHDYVPLYFNARNPMLYKRKEISNELAIIHFNRDLLLKDKVLFTDGNAASNATEFYHELGDLDKVDWDAIWARFWHDIHDGKRKRCAEVLVPKKIGFKHIEKIAVSSNSTLNHIDHKTRNRVDFVVDNKLFFWNDSRSRSRSSSGYGSRAWA